MKAAGFSSKPFPSAVIAGTNGKGSTAYMLSKLLEEHGLVTGLYISPHLVDLRERFSVNGGLISKEDLERLAARVMGIIEKNKLKMSFFEATTAIAVAYFIERKVDAAVMEVGMGGRYDAVNWLDNRYACVTSIGLDHTAYLGKNRGSIFREKAGVIKTSAYAVSGLSSGLKEKFIRVCKNAAADYEDINDVSVRVRMYGLEGTLMDCACGDFKADNFMMRLPGPWQITNFKLALLLARKILQDKGIVLSPKAVIQAAGSFCWPGRVQLIRRAPLVVFDGAHNPQAMHRLMSFVEKVCPGLRFTVIAGFMKDKDWPRMIKRLSSIACAFVFIKPDKERGADPCRCAEKARANTSVKDILVMESFAEAASFIAAHKHPLLITGSFYLAKLLKEMGIHKDGSKRSRGLAAMPEEV